MFSDPVISLRQQLLEAAPQQTLAPPGSGSTDTNPGRPRRCPGQPHTTGLRRRHRGSAKTREKEHAQKRDLMGPVCLMVAVLNRVNVGNGLTNPRLRGLPTRLRETTQDPLFFLSGDTMPDYKPHIVPRTRRAETGA